MKLLPFNEERVSNSKEWQDEFSLNMTAMDFRQYDNNIGRFNVIDPLAEQDYSLAPYHFGNNNPVLYSDPSGLKYTAPETMENYIAPGSILSMFMGGMSGREITEQLQEQMWGSNLWMVGTKGGGSGGGETGPGKPFDSPLDAAIDFGRNYNGFSIIKSLEVFSLIYQLNDKYYYLTPIVGGGGFVMSGIQQELLDMLNSIEGATLEASIHSHGSDPIEIRELVKNGVIKSSANKFSGDYDVIDKNGTFDGDINLYRNDSGKNIYGKPIKGYMSAPNGGLYFFDPSINYGTKNYDGSIRYEFKMPVFRDLPSDPYQGKQRLNTIDPTIISNLKFVNY